MAGPRAVAAAAPTPLGWFAQSKYSIEERLVHHRGVQEHETIRCRNVRIVGAGVNLAGGDARLERGVFNLEADEHGQLGFVVPESHQMLRKRYAEAKIPEVVKRPGGVQVVYVDPALKEHAHALEEHWRPHGTR